MSLIHTLIIATTTLSDAQANPNMHTLRIASQGTAPNATKPTSTAICDALQHKLEMFDVGAYIAYQHSKMSVLAIDDSVLYTLVQHCPKLSTLNMLGHAGISNEALSALSNLSILRRLDVCFCINLLDTGVVTIAERCPLLKGIFLSHCPHISNVGVNALAQYNRKLISVELQQREGIQDSDIQNLIRRYLEKLDIAWIPHLTFAAVAELPQYCFCMREVCLYWSKPDTMDSNEVYQRNKHSFWLVGRAIV